MKVHLIKKQSVEEYAGKTPKAEFRWRNSYQS